MDSKETTKVVLKNINRNIVASILSLCISILVGLVFPIFVIKLVGNEKYGLWVLWQSWLSIIQISLFGINSSILSILANLTETPSQFWISFKSYCALSSSVALIITIITCLICGLTQSENLQFGIILVLFLSFLFRILCELLILPTKTLQRYDNYYIQQNAYQLSFLILSIGFVAINKSLASLIISSFLSSTIQLIICYIYFLKALHQMNYSLNSLVLKTSISISSLQEFQHLGKMDIMNVVYALGSNFGVRQTIPVISDLNGLSYYDLATRVTSQVYSLAAIAFSNIIPSITYLNYHAPHLFTSFINKGHRYLTLIVVVLLCFLIAYSPYISLILLSKKIPVFIFILSALAIDGGLNLTTGIYTNALLALKDINLITKKLFFHILVIIFVTFMSLFIGYFHDLNKYVMLLTIGNLLAILLFYLDINKINYSNNLSFSFIAWLKILTVSVLISTASLYLSDYFSMLIFSLINFKNHLFYVAFAFIIFSLMAFLLATLLRIINFRELRNIFKPQ